MTIDATRMMFAQSQARVRGQFKDPRLRANVNWKDVNGARDMEAAPRYLGLIDTSLQSVIHHPIRSIPITIPSYSIIIYSI